MLRDRLTTLSSDLIEARSRISDLEAILAQDRQAIGRLSAELAASSTCTTDWARFLGLELNMDLAEAAREHSQESKTMAKGFRDAISNAAELEAELIDARERCVTGLVKAMYECLMGATELKKSRRSSLSPTRSRGKSPDSKKRTSKQFWAFREAANRLFAA